MMMPCLLRFLAAFTVGLLQAYAQDPSVELQKLDDLFLLEEPQLSFDTKPESLVSVPQGNSVKLFCEVTAIPPASVKWLKDGKEMDPKGADLDHRNEAEKLSNFGRKSLQLASTKSEKTIDCVDKNKAGVYTCLADNGYSKIKANATIVLADGNAVKPAACVEKKRIVKLSRLFSPSPARISMSTDMRMEVVSSSVQLFCRASGWPWPDISWYAYDNVEDDEHLGEGRKIENDRSHLVLSNGDLLIRSGLLADSMGSVYYRCVAENLLGSDSAVVTLVVIDED